jgi:spore germination protein GerM
VSRARSVGSALVLAVLPVVASLASCSGNDAAEPTTSTRITPTSAPSATTAATAVAGSCAAPESALVRPELDRTVSVMLICGDGDYPVDLVGVERVVPDDGRPLRAAIDQLLIGVTPAEAAAGLTSAFSSFTASQLRGATIEEGVATLDFTSGFETTNNFSTTNLASVVLSQIDATVFQFEEIDGLEFEVDGERWCGWENTCEDQPVPLRRRP